MVAVCLHVTQVREFEYKYNINSHLFKEEHNSLLELLQKSANACKTILFYQALLDITTTDSTMMALLPDCKNCQIMIMLREFYPIFAKSSYHPTIIEQ